ncbi:ABC transporter G family member 37 [Dendrobium catenatum]|uniref:ABC transporter G family member 37 n=1 Tax=Dendrobium catenatum TaxID=906689 RepID=A0A2I0V8P6_9ASPA|nr:ABC transporter G family member 37 [Dendrobium catenatum]
MGSAEANDLAKMESFSFSLDEDEEIQMQWAAIERLPTVKRLRSALFMIDNDDEKAGMRVVDVANLDAIQRRQFIENLIRNVEHDNRQLLEGQRERMRR